MATETVYIGTVDFTKRDWEDRFAQPLAAPVVGNTTESVEITTNLAGVVENPSSYSLYGTPRTTHDFFTLASTVYGHHTSAGDSTRIEYVYEGPLYVIRWKFSLSGGTEKYFYMVGSTIPWISQTSYEYVGSMVTFNGGVQSGLHSYPVIDTGLKMTISRSDLLPHTGSLDGQAIIS